MNLRKIFTLYTVGFLAVTILIGIAEALTTTIFGLAIAVPCIVAHSHFIRRIELLTMRLEALLANLANACEKTCPKP